MEKRFLKFLVRIYQRCTYPKRNWLKSLVAKILKPLTSFLVRAYLATFGSWFKTSEIKMEKLAKSLVSQNGDFKKVVEQLAQFVYQEIFYFPSNKWWRPVETLRFGLGDCKNKALLLQALLKSRGIEAEVKVGIIGRKTKTSSELHSWVSFTHQGKVFICDPSTSGEVMSKEEYYQRRQGFLDVTLEYILKRSNLKEGAEVSERRFGSHPPLKTSPNLKRGGDS